MDRSMRLIDDLAAQHKWFNRNQFRAAIDGVGGRLSDPHHRLPHPQIALTPTPDRVPT